MKLKEFLMRMKKPLFSVQEAHLVTSGEDERLTNLQLHQWSQQGELMRLKRGLYLFRDAPVTAAQVAKALCAPCYFSLDYALSAYGLLPEAVFTYTLLTPKTTQRYTTPVGTFQFHKVKRSAFSHFDPDTLLAEKEKALVDYFYFHLSTFIPEPAFWQELRLSPRGIQFRKVHRYASAFSVKKLNRLLRSYERYAKTHQTH